MIDRILQIVAPHHCYSCDAAGQLLCDNCKYDITCEAFSGCLVCRRPTRSGICSACKTYYEAAWCVGERSDTLKYLVDQVKFHRTRAGINELVDMLDAVLPVLPPDTIVVPVPTLPSHARRRGHAHVEQLAKELAQRRKHHYDPVLRRKNTAVQRGASRPQRYKQAQQAFLATRSLEPAGHWLIVDDVVTTGATLQFAAKELRLAGATQVFVAAVARQPLDNDSPHLLKYAK